MSDAINQAKRCIAKSGLYFPATSGPCDGTLVKIPDFYKSAADGDLDAFICTRHANLYIAMMNRKSYLYERLIAIKEMHGWNRP